MKNKLMLITILALLCLLVLYFLAPTDASKAVYLLAARSPGRAEAPLAAITSDNGVNTYTVDDRQIASSKSSVAKVSVAAAQSADSSVSTDVESSLIENGSIKLTSSTSMLKTDTEFWQAMNQLQRYQTERGRTLRTAAEARILMHASVTNGGLSIERLECGSRLCLASILVHDGAQWELFRAAFNETLQGVAMPGAILTVKTPMGSQRLAFSTDETVRTISVGD